MNARRFAGTRHAGLLFAVGVAVVGCNAILGTSDPTVEEAEAGRVVPLEEAGANDATMGPPSAPDAGDSGPDATGDSGGGTADGAPCVDACTLHATECLGGGVATCVAGADGCTSWRPTTTCGPLQACKLVGVTAMCVCQPSTCTGNGTACQGNLLATCGTDAFGCPFVVSSAPCPGSDVCSNPAPAATCTPTCVSTCTIGQTQCADPGSLQTCGMSAQGCDTYLASVACPAGQACSGAVGAASCVCNNTCPAAGVTCNGSSLQTCTADTNGCLSVTSSMACTTNVANATASCMANACAFVCDSGFVLCNGACIDASTDAAGCPPLDQ